MNISFQVNRVLCRVLTPVMSHMVTDPPGSTEVTKSICGMTVANRTSRFLPDLGVVVSCPQCVGVAEERRQKLKAQLRAITEDAAIATTTVAELLSLIQQEGSFEMKEQAMVISERGLRQMSDEPSFETIQVSSFEDLPDDARDALMRFVTGFDQDPS